MIKNLQRQNIKIGTWCFAIYLLLAPLDFLPVIEGVSFSKILIVLPIAGNLIYFKNYRIRIDKYFVIPFLYLMLVLFSLFYSVSISDTTQRIITLFLNIGTILFLSLRSYNRREILLLRKSIVYSGWLTLLLMLIYSDTSIMSGRLTVVVNGYYQDPNYLTGFLIFSIIYYFDDFIRLKVNFSAIKVVLFIVIILLTGSRGGLLAVVGAIIFYSIILSISKKFRIGIIAKFVLIVVLLGVFYVFVIKILPENIASRYTYESTIGSGGTGRVEIWKNVLYRYNTSTVFNKFFGNGAGAVRLFAYGKVAHNIWIENLIEVGIFGTFMLFVYYYVYLMNAIKTKEYVLSSSFAGYIFMGMSLSLYSYRPIWNILLLIIIIKNYNAASRLNCKVKVKHYDRDNYFKLQQLE